MGLHPEYERTVALLARQDELKAELQKVDDQLDDLCRDGGPGYLRAIQEDFDRTLARMRARIQEGV
jgi:uncharacterized membrane protein